MVLNSFRNAIVGGGGEGALLHLVPLYQYRYPILIERSDDSQEMAFAFKEMNGVLDFAFLQDTKWEPVCKADCFSPHFEGDFPSWGRRGGKGDDGLSFFRPKNGVANAPILKLMEPPFSD